MRPFTAAESTSIAVDVTPRTLRRSLRTESSGCEVRYPCLATGPISAWCAQKSITVLDHGRFVALLLLFPAGVLISALARRIQGSLNVSSLLGGQTTSVVACDFRIGRAPPDEQQCAFVRVL